MVSTPLYHIDYEESKNLVTETLVYILRVLGLIAQTFSRFWATFGVLRIDPRVSAL